MTSTDPASRTTRICAPPSGSPVSQCTPVVARSRPERTTTPPAGRCRRGIGPSRPRSSSVLRWNDSSMRVAISGLLNIAFAEDSGWRRNLQSAHRIGGPDGMTGASIACMRLALPTHPLSSTGLRYSWRWFSPWRVIRPAHADGDDRGWWLAEAAGVQEGTRRHLRVLGDAGTCPEATFCVISPQRPGA